MTIAQHMQEGLDCIIQALDYVEDVPEWVRNTIINEYKTCCYHRARDIARNDVYKHFIEANDGYAELRYIDDQVRRELPSRVDSILPYEWVAENRDNRRS